MSGLLQTVPRETGLPRWSRWGAIGGLLAASIAGILLLRTPTSPPPDQVRTEVEDETLRLQVIAPPESPLQPGEPIAFHWTGAGRDALYRLTVTDPAGAVLWREESRETVASLPATVRLTPGGTYFWRVDALLPDGRSATTGVRRFTLR